MREIRIIFGADKCARFRVKVANASPASGETFAERE